MNERYHNIQTFDLFVELTPESEETCAFLYLDIQWLILNVDSLPFDCVSLLSTMMYNVCGYIVKKREKYRSFFPLLKVVGWLVLTSGKVAQLLLCYRTSKIIC